MTTITDNNFTEQLSKLSQHDRQEIETFIGYLKSRPQKVPATVSVLTQNLNNKLLEGYIEEKIDYMQVVEDECDNGLNRLFIYFIGRYKPVSFNEYWFINDKYTYDPLIFGMVDNLAQSLFVKYRPGTNKIDKVAIDKKYLTEEGIDESKRRILALEEINSVSKNVIQISPDTTKTKTLGFVEYGNSSDLITASVNKSHQMFANINTFTKDRIRLDRVAEILFNFINTSTPNRYSWDSEFFYDQKHNFTDCSTNNSGRTIKLKAHFRPNDCLQISEFSLNKTDATIIVSVLVEETDSEYKLTVCGWISKDIFMIKAKPWNYNEKVILYSMELNELNDAKDIVFMSTITVYNNMIGKTISSISGEIGDDFMVFFATNGDAFRFAHNQDCCESVSIEEIIGDLDDLINSPIIEAEEISSEEKINESMGAKSYTWTFYRFSTNKGTVTIRWFGSSNGYYSESVHYSETLIENNDTN